MSIMKKAEELGEAIVASQEYDQMKGAEDKMQADEAAKAILQEFQTKQRMAQMAQMNGQQVTEDMQKELQAIQAKMQGNENIKNFMEAQEKFNKVMQTVNQVITAALTGEEPQECGSDCGAGCC
ncbi:YlbF family regulator [Halonatronum saccharophilum]|uniref:YlbF family regulator n=1 Tax=Halonatronum saccharophilum TaxID=150060 RepID=UPI000481E338|nr:YlbF family regulator [Halonatronum saccharophilum]